MRYLPATPAEIQEMLAAIGVGTLEELFASIPERYRLNRSLCLPKALSEWEVSRELGRLADQNPGAGLVSFLGGGAYQHIVSSVVDALISRSEFATAYTPYQPEVSQGTLQAIFEFQTYVCELTGMEVANASVYEAASGLAEACLMADRMVRKRASARILVSRGVNPQYRQVVKTYLAATDLEVVELPLGPDGATDEQALKAEVEKGALAVVVQSPNYLGVIEDLRVAGGLAKGRDAAFIVAVGEPISLGLLEPPGAFGADIVVAEGQGFGIPLSFGGPYVGMFATREKHMRSMPGRLVGKTVDSDGEDGFVLTLAAREQHIRREKATSNICTNQGLFALAVTIYLSLVGKEGLAQVARRNLSMAEWLKKAIQEVPGLELAFAGPTFNEFVVRSTQEPVDALLKRLEAAGVLGGIPLAQDYPELKDCFLVAVTEVLTRDELTRFVGLLRGEGV